MAKKFFRQKVQTKKRTVTRIIIISICIIGIAACFFMINYFNSRLPKDAKVELRDSLTIEINSEFPDKTTFFTELENVPEDKITINYDEVNISKIGTYPVLVKVYKVKYNVNLKVVDTFSPELILKDITIKEGEKYEAKDFVSSCIDNSKENCAIEFYKLATDQNGKNIDFANYTEEGTYNIQIIAKDSSDNQTIEYANLIIGEGDKEIDTPLNPTPTCNYGNDEYDSSQYIIASFVTENGCAINKDLYEDANVMKSIDAVMENETKKIQGEFQKLNINSAITLNRNKKAILNNEGLGIVGYSLHMELLEKKDENSKEEVVASYYIDASGKRTYSVNKYNLP